MIDLAKCQFIDSGYHGQYYQIDDQYGIKHCHHSFEAGLKEFVNQIRAYEWLGDKVAKPYFALFADDQVLIVMEHVDGKKDASKAEEIYDDLYGTFQTKVEDNHSGNIIFTETGYKLVDFGFSIYFTGETL